MGKTVTALLIISGGLVLGAAAGGTALTTASIMQPTPAATTLAAWGEAPGGWHPIDPVTAAELAFWGDASDRATRQWTLCIEHIDDTTVIACPDGHVETS